MQKEELPDTLQTDILNWNISTKFTDSDAYTILGKGDI